MSLKKILPDNADQINRAISEWLHPQGHCVGCGQGLVDHTVKFTPNTLPVCSDYCGSKAEQWLYPVDPSDPEQIH